MKPFLYDDRGSINKISEIKDITGFNKAFIIGGTAFNSSVLPEYLMEHEIEYVLFEERTTMPSLSDVQKAKDVFLKEGCDIIFSVGGGSIIDLGKMLAKEVYGTVHVAVPTVACTGSEATNLAVMYENDKPVLCTAKLPKYAILNKKLPGSLDEYTLKSDAAYIFANSLLMLVNEKSTKTVKKYANAAVKSFFLYGEDFVKGGIRGVEMLRAADYMGKALHFLYKEDESCYDRILQAIEKAKAEDRHFGHVLALDTLKFLEENHSDYKYLGLFRGLLEDYGLCHTSTREQIEWNVFLKEYGYPTGKRIGIIKKRLLAREIYDKERVDSSMKQILTSFIELNKAVKEGADRAALLKEIREYIISIKGYATDAEVPTINFTNALNKSAIKPSDKSIEELFSEVKKLFEEADYTKSDDFNAIFRADTADVNVMTLEGLMVEMGYMISEEDIHHKALRDLQIKRLIHWRRAVKVHEDEKHDEYLAMLHKAQLDMMDEIDRVCTENGLTYFLNYGSLLGAIRHKGYIPWDDDLDICMPREDYDRFREVCKEHMREPYYVYNNIDYDNCTFSMMKVMSRDTIFVRHDYRFGEDDGKRMFIDIWPLDNVPGPTEEVAKVKKLKSKYTGALRLKVRARCGEKLTFDQKMLLATYAPYTEKQLIKKREEVVTKWKDVDTDYWLSGGVYDYLKETHPKEWYLPPVRLPYEDRSYLFPGNYEALLKHFYGNYMKLPPLNKRFTHAPFEVQFGKDGEKMYFPPAAKRGGYGAGFKKKLKKYLREHYSKPGRKAINDAIVAKSAVHKNSDMRGLKDAGKGSSAIFIIRPEIIDKRTAEEICEKQKNGAKVFARVNMADYLKDCGVIADYLLADRTKKSINVPETVLELNDIKLICIKNRKLVTNIPEQNVIRLNYIYYPDGGMKNEDLSTYYRKNVGEGYQDFGRNIIRYMGYDEVEEI